MNGATSFPVARYRFEFQARQPIRLPDYSGSMLRGAFGHALRQLACMTRQKECAACPLIGSCPYPAIFAPPPPATHSLQKFSQIPAPYVIEPPAWGSRVLAAGETLTFHHVLIGRALQELPLIILAWRRALARGVGAGDGTADLVRVVHCSATGDEEIHRPQIGTIAAHAQVISLVGQADDGLASTATLRFETPLRLQQNGHALPPEKLQARTLLMALARRASLLAEFHSEGPLVDDFAALSAACASVRDEKSLTWLDWTRFSSRQQQKMSLGGVVGTWRFEGKLAPFAPLLQLGEWLHVGKEAAFGLGRYELAQRVPGDISDDQEKSCERPRQVFERQARIP
ncbi:MAG: CRISPR system precrRNA processing endoribonuclease RAMP protein Cas6 [Candidatus Accumulibacter phosphatis]|uniref:CRISPR system precrRNA processing endoribonuclease RAMP protein Cas6 n=1 Tax=Candidatus Accumulibacter phosphatis TaxID=327160 RepID=UPI001A3F5776|nr:CRISPR system precrRNA processing endoribonuclease RAMP protein Cas6 [Candidatus Accumulibacter phosphatis]